MKKLWVLGSMFGLLLTGCSSNQPVAVVKGIDQSTVAPTPVKHIEIPANMPTNVTAICRDGSHSTATQNVCAGNGGIATEVRRYYSE